MAPTDEERLVESLKLEFERQKHLTTLTSGIVVALVTILQAFFAVGENGRPYSPLEVVFLAMCFVSLVSGLLLSIVIMASTIRDIREAREPDRLLEAWGLIAPLMSLVGGLLSFVVFAALRTGLVDPPSPLLLPG